MSLSKKRVLSVLAAALLVILCAVPAMANDGEPEFQDIGGAVNASELAADKIIRLNADTVLTLDADKTIFYISGNGYTLTVQGDCGLTFNEISVGRIIVNGGKLNATFPNDEEGTVIGMRADDIEINGGEITASLPIVAETLTVNGGVIRASGYLPICADHMTVTGGRVYTANFAGIGGTWSWAGMIYGCDFNMSGGYVEAKGVSSSDDDWSVGAAFAGANITGGVFVAEGSVTAVNSWDVPITTGENMKLLYPADGYVSPEQTDSEKAEYGWSGYSILNADGTRATKVVIAPKDASDITVEDADTGETLSYVCADGCVTVTGDISEDSPVFAALYDESGRMLSCRILLSPDTLDAAGAASAKLIWLDSAGYIAKSQCIDIDIS